MARPKKIDSPAPAPVVVAAVSEQRRPGRQKGESINKVISARRKLLASVKLAVLEHVLPTSVTAGLKTRTEMVIAAADLWSEEVRLLAQKSMERTQLLADENPADHDDETADDC